MRRSNAAAAAASFVAFFVGTILILLPWSALWENNHFFDYIPYVKAVLLTKPARAAVSGLGVFDLIIGVGEARRLTAERHEPPAEP